MTKLSLRFWLTLGVLLWALCFIIVLAEDSDAAAYERPDWKAHAAQMEAKYALPVGLLGAICEQESNWRNGLTGTSGEIGLCQVQVNTVHMICSNCSNGHQGSFALDSAGNAVQHIQRSLTINGYYHDKIDGIFGPATQAATIAYQKAKALRVDGVVGPQTWAVLVNEPYPGTSIATTLWTPKGNIEWAARYLAWLRDHVSSDPMIMMAAYNGGPANPIVAYMVSVNKKWGRT